MFCNRDDDVGRRQIHIQRYVTFSFYDQNIPWFILWEHYHGWTVLSLGPEAPGWRELEVIGGNSAIDGTNTITTNGAALRVWYAWNEDLAQEALYSARKLGVRFGHHRQCITVLTSVKCHWRRQSQKFFTLAQFGCKDLGKNGLGSVASKHIRHDDIWCV